jgi:membrane fusion protein
VANAVGSELEAHLFAQSKDAGFVREGQQVFLRYSAYPYQKFGHYRAKVVEVARTPLLPAELPFPIAPKTETGLFSDLSGATAQAAATASTEPLFRIRVALESQTARTYGVDQPLQSGMQLDADVMLDTRTIFEWVMEPVYSLRGKYFGGQE